MTHLILAVSLFFISSTSNAQDTQDVFAACEEVSEMAILAKDNVPFWTTNRNSAVQSCYEDIKEFLIEASAEDMNQFNTEYTGQIVIYTSDIDFANHIRAKAQPAKKYSFPIPASQKITPNITPHQNTFFGV